MFPALVCAAIAGQLIKVRDPQLPNDCFQHCVWHIHRVFEKSAEKAGGGELQRETQPVMVATIDTDHGVVSVIQMEKAR